MTGPVLGEEGWVDVCDVSLIPPDAGVCALVEGEQVAVFRLRDREGGDRLHAVSNHDPFSGANVLSRGIVGDRDGVPTVASPVYKQRFALESGRCLDDPDVRIPLYEVRTRGALVQVRALVP